MRYRELNNKVTPAIPYLFLYDEDGGQTFGNPGTYHTWDTVKVKTSHFIYNADDDRITFKSNTSGFYKIIVNISWYITDEGSDTVTTKIYKNGSELTASRVIDFLITADTDKASQSMTYIAYLSKDDYIQIFSESGGGNGFITLSSASRLIIEYIPMRGWDNSNGGRIEYKGDVMR